MTRPAQARLDLAALRHNVGVARALAPHARLMAVVKANAYGHGAVTIAGALQHDVDALAVACMEEALELRYAGIAAPILLLEGVFNAAELATASQLDLWLTIDNERQLRWLEEAALPLPLTCWLKVDTGMNRLGVTPAHAPLYFQRLRASVNAHDDIVICTHFACADDVESARTLRQLDVFNALDIPSSRSAANSAGVLAWPQSHYEWVRPGYMLYGNSPMVHDHANAHALLPVMTLASAVISLRDVATGDAVGYGGTWVAPRPSRIATVAIGYGDGYPRGAPNGTPVLVNGQRAALAGRVSMDMITVDVTDLTGVEAGAEVVLWGAQLPQAEVALCAGTLGYELTTRMPARTPRIVVNA
jgi:alanine racemase